MSTSPSRIAILLYPGVEPMDYQGPCAVFEYLLSVCTGVFLLQTADLIKRQRVTTHWEFKEELSQSGDLEVCGEQHFIQDGRVWTAAGIFSGIDMALAFINSFDGSQRPDGRIRSGEAGRVQLSGQYFPVHRHYPPGELATPPPRGDALG